MQPRLAIQARPAAFVTTGKISRPPASREADVHGLEPVRMWVRDALLIEEIAVDAVGVAQHLHRPPRDVGEQLLGQLDVMADEITLREPALGEEDLVRVRDLDVVPADAHGAEATGPEITLRGDGGP
jgi:hypothetical protein